MTTDFPHGFRVGDKAFIPNTAWYGEIVGAGPDWVRVYYGAHGTHEYREDALELLLRDRAAMLAKPQRRRMAPSFIRGF